MPPRTPNITPTREQWRAARDAAHLPQGYTKASIGDLWDAFLTASGQKNAFNTSWSKFVSKIDRKGALDNAVNAAIKMWGAIDEYKKKLIAERKLIVAKDVDPEDDETENEQEQTAPEIQDAVAALDRMAKCCMSLVVNLAGESKFLKAYPQQKAALDLLKKRKNDPLPTREVWQRHRDGAGLPQGYVQADVGGALEALRTRLGPSITSGLDGALDALEPAQAAPLGAAATAMGIAVVQYRAKLEKDKKTAEPAIGVVLKDLKMMSKTAISCAKAVGTFSDFFIAVRKAHADATAKK